MGLKFSFFQWHSKKRQAWEATVVWRRVRYTNPAALKKCLLWLTTSEKIQRIGIFYCKGEKISHLYLGIPKQGEAVFAQMCHDYGFSIALKPHYIQPPTEAPLSYVAHMEWERPFYAHLVGNALFIQDNDGNLFPFPDDPLESEWELPQAQGLLPELDLTISTECETTFQATVGWPLGFGFKTATPLMHQGAINLYGSSEATAKWLDPVALSILSNAGKGLIILDGLGNLVPLLKRKAPVVQKLGETLLYLDLDSHLISGFNPLASTPFEKEGMYLQRIKQWFIQMGLPPQYSTLIETAIIRDGVRTFQSLARWVDLPAQQRLPREINRLKGIVSRLLAKRGVRDRLEWPTNPFDTLPEGELLFSCKQKNWEQVQMMVPVLLGAIQARDAFVILHGIDWSQIDVESVYPRLRCRNLIISNGPPLPNGLKVFTASHPERARKITQLFFENDERIEENLNILAPGQALLRNEQRQIGMTRWGQ